MLGKPAVDKQPQQRFYQGDDFAGDHERAPVLVVYQTNSAATHVPVFFPCCGARATCDDSAVAAALPRDTPGPVAGPWGTDAPCVADRRQPSQRHRGDDICYQRLTRTQAKKAGNPAVWSCCKQVLVAVASAPENYTIIPGYTTGCAGRPASLRDGLRLGAPETTLAPPTVGLWANFLPTHLGAPHRNFGLIRPASDESSSNEDPEPAPRAVAALPVVPRANIFARAVFGAPRSFALPPRPAIDGVVSELLYSSNESPSDASAEESRPRKRPRCEDAPPGTCRGYAPPAAAAVATFPRGPFAESLVSMFFALGPDERSRVCGFFGVPEDIVRDELTTSGRRHATLGDALLGYAILVQLSLVVPASQLTIAKSEHISNAAMRDFLWSRLQVAVPPQFNTHSAGDMFEAVLHIAAVHRAGGGGLLEGCTALDVAAAIRAWRVEVPAGTEALAAGDRMSAAALGPPPEDERPRFAYAAPTLSTRPAGAHTRPHIDVFCFTRSGGGNVPVFFPCCGALARAPDALSGAHFSNSPCTAIPGRTPIHTGTIEMGRLTKTQATKAGKPASWSCCGASLVEPAPAPQLFTITPETRTGCTAATLDCCFDF